MDNPKNTPPNSPSTAPGYETRDANVGGVLNFLVGLTVGLIITAIVSWGLFRYLSAQPDEPASVSPFAETRQLPLGPQLQVNPRQELLQYREEQGKSLDSYTWENRTTGTVRVPIDEAKELLLKKGLPVQAPAAASAPAQQGVKP
jgi:hypothetical protein